MTKEQATLFTTTVKNLGIKIIELVLDDDYNDIYSLKWKSDKHGYIFTKDEKWGMNTLEVSDFTFMQCVDITHWPIELNKTLLLESWETALLMGNDFDKTDKLPRFDKK
jgi:hypothetical protein